MAQVSKIMVHNWEEPFLTNSCSTNPREHHGSGAIFFSSCNLRCVYCQNYSISQTTCGQNVSSDQLIEIFKKLESQNVCNINLVTPTHFVKQIISALTKYKPKVPVVYNTSGYETAETIKALRGLVDIFLFDFKYASSDKSSEYSHAPAYVKNCKIALCEAKKQQKNDIFEGGIMKSGVVVRHLLLPGCSSDAIEILNYLHDTYGKNKNISLLNQFTPCGEANAIPSLNHRPKPIEYKRVVSYAKTLDMPNIFIQDESSATEEFIPDFSTFCDF